MYWIFILNDLVSKNSVVLAQDIVDYLLANRMWQYSSSSPNINKINKGDRALIYLAGIGRRYFYAEIEIQEQNKLMSVVPNQGEIWKADFNKTFKLGSSIDTIEIFKPSIILDEALRNELSFIGDKKNWGLYFRQAIKNVSVQDYQMILNRKTQ